MFDSGHALCRVCRGRGKHRVCLGGSISNSDKSAALREAIREYEANKWKAIGQKLGKPAKVSFLYFPFISIRDGLTKRNVTGMRTICKRAFQEWLMDVRIDCRECRALAFGGSWTI